jgi:hypothetical protein
LEKLAGFFYVKIKAKKKIEFLVFLTKIGVCFDFEESRISIFLTIFVEVFLTKIGPKAIKHLPS